MSIRDLTGQRFGRLVVVELHEKNERNQAVWRCVCDCGQHCSVIRGSLVSGRTRSCGCLARERGWLFDVTPAMREERARKAQATMAERKAKGPLE